MNIEVALPIADRRTSMDFYRSFLQLDAPGEPAEDGIPEPLSFPICEGFDLLLIPSGGFNWVIESAGNLADRGSISALMTVPLTTHTEVDEAVKRAVGAGGAALRPAQVEEWGYSAIIADPDGHLWQIVAEEAND